MQVKSGVLKDGKIIYLVNGDDKSYRLDFNPMNESEIIKITNGGDVGLVITSQGRQIGNSIPPDDVNEILKLVKEFNRTHKFFGSINMEIISIGSPIADD